MVGELRTTESMPRTHFHALTNAHVDKRSQISDDTGLYRCIPWAEIITRCFKEKCIHNTLVKFKWNIRPFGLALLPSYYSKAMLDTLSGLEDFARNYMDDLLVASYTEKEHLDHIRQVFV